MLDKLLFDKTNAPLLLKGLDASLLRGRTIANNIANVNTPGYHRLEVSFEDELRSALDKNRVKGSTTQNGHIQLGRQALEDLKPVVERPVDPTMSSGVNNVDIDTEMAKMAENQILFTFLSNRMRGTMSKINAAIQARPLPIQ